MKYLIDTNVISEVRKGPRCHPGVSMWFAATPDSELFMSVLTLGEIRKGIELVRGRDLISADTLDSWLEDLVQDFSDRIVPVDHKVAQEWGHLNVPDPIPVIDGLLAATARVHDMSLVTRNVGDIERTGVRFFDPFATGLS